MESDDRSAYVATSAISMGAALVIAIGLFTTSGSRAASKPARSTAEKATKTPVVPPPGTIQPNAVTPLTHQYSFALYQIQYRFGAPKSSAAFDPQAADGACRLTHIPLDGAGPWMDSGRSQWHRYAFEQMMRASVNVALVQYRPDEPSLKDWGRRGVDMAAEALREMRDSGEPTPTLGLFIDFSGHPAWNLGQTASREALFSVIRSFYRRVPADFRATVELPAAQDRPGAIPVFLGAPQGLTGWSPEFVTDLRTRFKKEFGHPVALAADESWRAEAPNMDAYFDLDPLKPFNVDESGPIHIATLTPSYNERGLIAGETPIRPRLNGRAYVAAWNDVGNKNPDWVLLDSWNGWADGTELAPSREAGDRDLNLTRAALAHLDSSAELRARLLNQSVPTTMQSGGLSRVEFRVENAGLEPWPQSISSLRYEWVGNGEVAASGESSLLQTITARQENRVGLLVSAKGAGPLPVGDYTLRFVLSVPGTGKTGGDLSLGEYPVHVGPISENIGTLLECDLPSPIGTGQTYTPRIRVRNDGATSWTRADHFVTYRWRRVPEAPAGGADPLTFGEKTALRTPLKVDVPPGAIVDLPAQVAAMDDVGQPLEASSPGDPWRYELEWRISGPEGDAAVREPVSVEISDHDPGVEFPLSASVPQEIDADSQSEVKVVVRNTGPMQWKAGQVSVACRWFYWDGVSMDTVSPRVAVKGPLGDLKPGQQALVRIPIQTPPFGGMFLIEVDSYVDDSWSSSAPVARGQSLVTLPVTVKGGGFDPLPLDAIFNFDGISPDSLTGDGNFDGSGHTFPGQLLPPLVTPDSVRSTLYPSGYLGATHGIGLDADRRVPFSYPAKQDGAMNMIACSGQSLKIRAQRPTALHLLMAADEAVDADFGLTYEDGSQEHPRVSFTSWDKPPAFSNESVAYYTPVRNGPNGVERFPAYLKHYVIECDPKRTLVQVDLPNEPHIKLMAITMESW